MRFRLAYTVVAVAAFALSFTTAVAQEETARNKRPVDVVAAARLQVGSSGAMPLFVSQDWSKPLPGIARAVVVLHGRLRNADVYYRTGLAARDAAGPAGTASLVIAPQFLSEIDVDAFKLPSDTFRWTLEGWQGGEAALAPRPASSFEMLDAILLRLADRAMFPALKQIVVAGHSGGGQVAQRYAVTTAVGDSLERAGIGVRYVVANPSSYAYFTPDRPDGAVAASCPGYDTWKYGMQERPPYLANGPASELEARYVARRVVYLLGRLDIDPNHPALDKSCQARAQGPHRYGRGHAFVAIMQARHAGLPRHSVLDIEGVGHSGDKMFTSTCGLAALFDLRGCGLQH